MLPKSWLFCPPGKEALRLSNGRLFHICLGAMYPHPTGQKSSAILRRKPFSHPSWSHVSWRMSNTISVLESSVAGITTDDHRISWCEVLIYIIRVGYPLVLLLITYLGDRYCARLSSTSEGIQLSFWLSVQRAKYLINFWVVKCPKI